MTDKNPATYDDHYVALAHADRMDLRRLELDAEERKAKIAADATVEKERQATKRQRWETARDVLIGVCVVALLGWLVWLWYSYASGPETPSPEIAREEACMDRGGTWIPESMLYDADTGICVMPGQDVTK